MTPDTTRPDADDLRLTTGPPPGRWNDAFALALLWVVPLVALLIVVLQPGADGL